MRALRRLNRFGSIGFVRVDSELGGGCAEDLRAGIHGCRWGLDEAQVGHLVHEPA